MAFPCRVILLLVAALAAARPAGAVLVHSGAWGQCLSPPDDGIAYVANAAETFVTSQGIYDRRHLRLSHISACVAPPVGGVTAVEDFFADVSFDLSVNGNDAEPISVLGAPVTLMVTDAGTAGGIATYDIELVRLDIALTGLGLFRESPVLHSLGVTTVANAGFGDVEIESFFGIYSDFSLDDGVSWVAGALTGQEAGPSAVPATLEEIPEPPMVVLLAMGMAAVIVLRRNGFRPSAPAAIYCPRPTAPPRPRA